MTSTERSRSQRERRRAEAVRGINVGASTSTAMLPEPMITDSDDQLVAAAAAVDQCMYIDYHRSPAFDRAWVAATERFENMFVKNLFGSVCGVCNRLWFLTERHMPLLESVFAIKNVAVFMLCSLCHKSLERDKIPSLSRSNRFPYPPKQTGPPPLDPVSTRLISLRLPFMQIRRLRYVGAYTQSGPSDQHGYHEAAAATPTH